jgi:hypothetical protein
MHKADELAVNITFLLYINTTGFANEFVLYSPLYGIIKIHNHQSSLFTCIT